MQSSIRLKALNLPFVLWYAFFFRLLNQPLGERDETQKLLLPPATTELLLFLVVSSSEQGLNEPCNVLVH